MAAAAVALATAKATADDSAIAAAKGKFAAAKAASDKADAEKANGNGPTIEQYSDLEGVPCMLILCEKGKMGECILQTVNLRSLGLS